MARKKTDKRREERISTVLPVDLGGAAGVTRDVSATGIFFETDADYAVGSPASFTVELDSPWGKLMFRCEGKIVRVESHDSRVGVAVAFTESQLDPVT